VTNAGCEEARDDAWTAGYVEQRVFCMRRSAVGHQHEQRVVALPVALEKRLSLARELIEDLSLMLRCIPSAIVEG